MARIEEQTTVAGEVEDVFGYVADFANTQEWDPGVAATERLTPRPVGTGSRFRVDVAFFGRTSPMEYTITAFEPPRRVVIAGEGRAVRAVDDIRFEPVGAASTAITYIANIQLKGPLRLLEPFMGSAFDRIGKRAMAGLEQTLGTPG